MQKKTGIHCEWLPAEGLPLKAPSFRFYKPMIRLFKNIWFILTVDCETSASLTSESFDRKLHWSESVAVSLHCLICSKSRRLNRQMIAMDQKLREVSTSEPEIAEHFRLDDAARQRIAKAIEDYGQA